MKKMDFNLKIKKIPMNTYLGKYKSDLNLNWNQVKRKHPHLKPYSDTDIDGTLNLRDCRPLNPAKDGIFKKLFGNRKIHEQRAIKLRTHAKTQVKRVVRGIAELPEKVLIKGGDRIMERVAKTQKRSYPRLKRKVSSGGKVGRPAGVYKHTHPITGKSLPATVYYKVKRNLTKRSRLISEQTRLKEQAILASKYGVPPQITKLRQEARLRELKPEQYEVPTEIQVENGTQPEEIQQEVTEIPEGYHQNGGGVVYIGDRPAPYQMKYKVVTDLMTGNKIIKQLPQQERWQT